MMVIRINGESYDLITHWKELNLRQAKELHAIINKAPESLQALWECSSEEEAKKIELSDEDMYKAFPTFYGEVLAYLGSIPEDVMKHVLAEERRVTYKSYCESVVRDIIRLPEDIEEIKSFKWKGKTYRLPVSKDVMGRERIGAYMESIEFTESNDIQMFTAQTEGGKYEKAANVISILCRPKGEPYDEDKCLKRAETFSELPLSIVNSVFFSVISSIKRYSLSLMSSSLKAGVREKLTGQVDYTSLDGRDQSSVFQGVRA